MANKILFFPESDFGAATPSFKRGVSPLVSLDRPDTGFTTFILALVHAFRILGKGGSY